MVAELPSRQNDAKNNGEMLAGLSSLTLELHRGAPSREPQVFNDWALRLLAQYVHFDSALWASGYADAQGSPVVKNWWLHRQPEELLADYARIAHHDVLFQTSLSQPGVSVVWQSRDGRMQHFDDYIDRYGIEHALNTCDIDPLTGLLNDIALWRAERDRPFDEADRVFMQAAFPHLIEACARNRLIHLSRAANPRSGGPWSAAAADRGGLLLYAEGEFPRLLRDEWPQWSGPQLPPQLTEGLSTTGAHRITANTLVCKLTPVGELVLLQARQRTEIDLLTNREREIATYTAQGLSHKDIARLLDLSPATVRNHLAASCRRLQARNKAQLAALVQRYE